MIIYDFDNENVSNWRVVDDGVMGGLSRGQLTATEEGHARFHGEVSLENNGGFSSIQINLGDEMEPFDSKAFVVRVKGDGKPYAFRVSRADIRYSYQKSFVAGEKWDEVRIPFNEMVPVYRGNKLDKPAYTGEAFNELQVLIGNKKAESFELLMDWIRVSR